MEGERAGSRRRARDRNQGLMKTTGPNAADHGNWGRLSGEGRSAAVIRLILLDRTVSFPYHTLVRWEYSVGESEMLLLYAGNSVVTITGRRLVRLRDGLDAGRLEQVRSQGERAALRAAVHEPWIQGITVKSP